MTRDSLRNKFQDLGVDKPLEIEVEGEPLELDVRAKDVSNLMMVGQQDNVDEETMDKLEETLRRILYRSYLPYYNRAGDKEMESLDQRQEEEQEDEREFIEGLLARYYIDLFTGITQELGWHDGDIDATGLEDAKKNSLES